MRQKISISFMMSASVDFERRLYIEKATQKRWSPDLEKALKRSEWAGATSQRVLMKRRLELQRLRAKVQRKLKMKDRCQAPELVLYPNDWLGEIPIPLK